MTAGLWNLLLLAPLGILIWWGLLRLMDYAAGIAFHETINRIEADPLASALYFGLRAIATALLVGDILFSRWIR